MAPMGMLVVRTVAAATHVAVHQATVVAEIMVAAVIEAATAVGAIGVEAEEDSTEAAVHTVAAVAVREAADADKQRV
jgi:hypothetical protein